ncbi:hypothetical protein GGX14DRAFT_643677, partial [Mycena pura]
CRSTTRCPSHLPTDDSTIPCSPAAELAQLGVRMSQTLSQEESSQHLRRAIRQTESIQLMNAACADNATNLQVAANAVSFASLFLDVLGGTVAIVGAVQLQGTYGLLKLRESALAGLKNTIKLPESADEQDALALALHLQYLEKVIFPPLHSPRLWDSLSPLLKQSADLLPRILMRNKVEDHLQISFSYFLADYRHTTNSLASTRFLTSIGFAASSSVCWSSLG